MVPAIMQGLQCHEKPETLKGSINLCECVFSVLDQESFEQVYMSMVRALRGAADTQMGNFKADMLTMQSQQELAAATNPLAMRLMA